MNGEAAFAMLCGVAPSPESSGMTGGNGLTAAATGQANHALHLAVVSRLRPDPIPMLTSRRRPPKVTPTGVIRCLRRYLARDIYNPLNPASQPRHPTDHSLEPPFDKQESIRGSNYTSVRFWHCSQDNSIRRPSDRSAGRPVTRRLGSGRRQWDLRGCRWRRTLVAATKSRPAAAVASVRVARCGFRVSHRVPRLPWAQGGRPGGTVLDGRSRPRFGAGEWYQMRPAAGQHT